MNEYFVFSNSFAAPFFSDSDTRFVNGKTPRGALKSFIADYKHPAGLYFAALFDSAEAYHKGKKPLLTWTCNHQLALEKATKKLNSGYSVLGHEPGRFEVNHKEIKVANPKGGKFIEVSKKSA